MKKGSSKPAIITVCDTCNAPYLWDGDDTLRHRGDWAGRYAKAVSLHVGWVHEQPDCEYPRLTLRRAG